MKRSTQIELAIGAAGIVLGGLGILLEIVALAVVGLMLTCIGIGMVLQRDLGPDQ